MKINEKNLAAFASSSTQVDREGYLMKRGDGGGGIGGSGHGHSGPTSSSSTSLSSSSSSTKFVKRWFVLKGNLLFYFDKKSDREPLGVIILEGSTVELADSESEEHFCFKVTFPSKSYILSADSQSALESWMKSLACASYDYVKLLADELQRQLDELCKNEGDFSISNPSAGDSGQEVKKQVPTPPPRVRASKSAIVGRTQPIVDVPLHPSQSHHHQARSVIVRKSFTTLHEEYGLRILRDQKSRWSGTGRVTGFEGDGEMEKMTAADRPTTATDRDRPTTATDRGRPTTPSSSFPLSLGQGSVGSSDLMNF